MKRRQNPPAIMLKNQRILKLLCPTLIIGQDAPDTWIYAILILRRVQFVDKKPPDMEWMG